jgi:hypothetical protein
MNIFEFQENITELPAGFEMKSIILLSVAFCSASRQDSLRVFAPPQWGCSMGQPSGATQWGNPVGCAWGKAPVRSAD